MSIETFWYDEVETIICQRLIHPLAWKDFKDAFQRTQDMDSNYVIVDAREVPDLPRGLLSQQKPLTDSLKTSDRVVVTGGAPTQFSIFAVSFFRVAAYGIIKFVDTLVDTLDEAETFIRQIQAERSS